MAKNPPSTLILFIKTFFYRGFSLIFLAKNHTPHVKSMEEGGKLGPKHVTTVEQYVGKVRKLLDCEE